MKGRVPNSFEIVKGKDAPGPGAYQAEKPIGTNAPKISMHGQLKSKHVKDPSLPGPGQYEAKLDLIKSRILIPLLSSSLRGTDPKRNDSPGPGAYE